MTLANMVSPDAKLIGAFLVGLFAIAGAAVAIFRYFITERRAAAAKKLLDAQQLVDEATELMQGHAGAAVFPPQLSYLGGKEENDLRQALQKLASAIAFDPRNFDAHNKRGIALQRFGRADEAMAEYDLAAAIKPSHWAPLNNKGNVLFASEQFAAAAQHFQDSTRLAPESTGLPFANYAKFYRYMNRMDEAETMVMEALRREPTLIGAHVEYGHILSRKGDLDGAENQYRLAIRSPTCVEAKSHVRLGEIALQRNSGEEAIEHFKKAIEIDSNSARAHRGLAAAYRIVGQPGSAGEAERTAKQLEEWQASLRGPEWQYP